eukprot:765068-Hanusia_phi.AAC.1
MRRAFHILRPGDGGLAFAVRPGNGSESLSGVKDWMRCRGPLRLGRGRKSLRWKIAPRADGKSSLPCEDHFYDDGKMYQSDHHLGHRCVCRAPATRLQRLGADVAE